MFCYNMKKEIGILIISFVLVVVVFADPEDTSAEVCKRPSFTGRCRAFFRRWYWDQVNCECKQFVYGGCQSNGNNFETQEDCMEDCGETHCEPTPGVCTKPKYTGRCRAYFKNWYWDFDACECKQFVYGGCGSNGNNFHTKADCMETCQSSHCPKNYNVQAKWN